MTTKAKIKTPAGGSKPIYTVSNGTETYGPYTDRSNANRKAKALNAKTDGAVFTVTPVGSTAPTVAKLQAAVNKAEATINGTNGNKPAKPAKGKTAKVAGEIAVIVLDGKKLALKRKSSGATYATRAAKPSGLDRLVKRAAVYGFKVENLDEAKALVAKTAEAK